MTRILLAALILLLVAPWAAAEEEDLEKVYDKMKDRRMPRDGFPVLHNPKLIPASESKLADDEPIIGIAIGDEAKAYPVAKMGFHELANDTCGGRPIAVSW